jgi:GTPase SAR1 family protein
MSKLTDIKRRIDELDGGAFQNLCDTYLCYKGYGNGYSLGMATGSDKTAKGNPDTYFLTADSKYVFVMYTTQKTDFFNKAIEDIDKCFDDRKTGVKGNDVAEIIYCHTYGRLTAGEDKKLRDYCAGKGAILNIIGLDVLGNEIFMHYPIIAKDQLGISVGTGQISSIEVFMQVHDNNRMSAPLNTEFMFREKEIEIASEMLERSNILLVYGPSGVGKTRFSVELCKKLEDEQGYKTICIRSNGLEIYEDLLSAIEPNEKYVAFVDDANELAGLQFVLEYLQNNDGKKISKIIITVRDYAQREVLNKILDYEKPEKIRIGTLKDEDIRKLIEVCYDIKNNIYSDRIVEIAEGNARIAMLAGKLIKETGRLESIMDASELYANYYGKQLEEILSSSKTEIYSAGIIAFLQSIRLDALAKLSGVFSAILLTADDFISDIKHLYSLEIVDLCNDKATKISDQTFSNFLIKYVFVDKKLIPLDLMIKVCFRFNKIRTISACNILLNVFSDSNVRSYLEEQINKLWDEIKNDNDIFPEFFKAFHMIRPTETLLLLQERVENEPPIDFDAAAIDFKINNDGTHISDEIIELLCSFNNCEQMSEAIELLLEYYTKRPDLFNEVYTAFIREFGIDKDSERLKYCSVSKAVEYLCGYIKTNNNSNSLALFVRIAIYYLKFVVSKTEGGRRNTFTFYTIPVNATKEVMTYRKMLLNELQSIYKRGFYKKEIEIALNTYGTGNSDYINYKIVKEEYLDVMSIVAQLQTDNLFHCLIVKHLKKIFEKGKVDFDHEIIDKFINSPKSIIYSVINGDRKDYLSMTQEEEHAHRSAITENLIKDYSIQEYKFLFQIAQEVDREFEDNSYSFSSGLNYVFDIVSLNGSLYSEIVDLYLSSNTPCNASPAKILSKLYNFMTADEVKVLIEKHDFNQKNTWLWHFYVEMPENQISEKHINELISFFANPPTQLKLAACRPLDGIKNFISVDSSIFEKASRTILANYDKCPFVFNLYFDFLFNPHYISPKKLISMYAFDMKLLSAIYLKGTLYSEHFDYNGEFLTEFLKVYPDLIDEYLIQVTQPEKYRYRKYEHYMERLRGVWKENDYINKVDYIVCKLYELFEDSRWDFEHCVEHLFVLEYNDKEEIVARQNEWFDKCVENNYNDSGFMNSLFGVISELPVDRRRKALLKFLSLNSNYDDFEKIPLEPSSWGGSGSMIPYMQNRITYLSSLIPSLSGVKYLKHKQRVEQHIDMWKERIKSEEIRELLENWF